MKRKIKIKPMFGIDIRGGGGVSMLKQQNNTLMNQIRLEKKI